MEFRPLSIPSMNPRSSPAATRSPSRRAPDAPASAAAAPAAASPPAPLPPATLVADDRQSGTRAVKLPAGPLYAHRFSQSPAIRERPAWGEFRFLRFAFRKKGAGRICLQLNHRQTEDRPARYDAGQGQPCFPQTRRVQDGALQDQWTVITRDLFADFGPLDVEGITLSAPDGQYVLFDQIYLARTVDDFRFLPQRPATDPAAEEANRTALAAVKERAVPSTVVIDFGDGRTGTGTIISGEGDILTAGHLTIAPNRNAKVTLADGREIAVPLEWAPRLQQATPKQRKNWRLIGGGVGIHWEDVDEDLSVESLLAVR